MGRTRVVETSVHEDVAIIEKRNQVRRWIVFAERMQRNFNDGWQLELRRLVVAISCAVVSLHRVLFRGVTVCLSLCKLLDLSFAMVCQQLWTIGQIGTQKYKLELWQSVKLQKVSVHCFAKLLFQN